MANGFEAQFNRAIDGETLDKQRPVKRPPAPQVKMARDTLAKMKKDVKKWVGQ